MNNLAVFNYGQEKELINSWGLNGLNSQKIALIIMCAGSIEFYAERALWKIRGDTPKDGSIKTDVLPITKIISQLEKETDKLTEPLEKKHIELWCRSANNACTIRNNIAHGLAYKLGNSLTFTRNPQWENVKRKRSFGDFWADENTLNFVSASFATLLRIIFSYSEKDILFAKLEAEAIKALKEANSILEEFSSQNYNPSFEKY